MIAKQFCAILLVFLINSAEIRCISEEMQELIDQLHKTCVDETGVDEDLIVKARSGDFANDEKLKCYLFCILDQTACISADGVIDVEAVSAMAPPEVADKVVPIFKKCGSKVGATPCESAWLTNQCYQKEGPEVYFLP